MTSPIIEAVETILPRLSDSELATLEAVVRYEQMNRDPQMSQTEPLEDELSLFDTAAA